MDKPPVHNLYQGVGTQVFCGLWNCSRAVVVVFWSTQLSTPHGKQHSTSGYFLRRFYQTHREACNRSLPSRPVRPQCAFYNAERSSAAPFPAIWCLSTTVVFTQENCLDMAGEAQPLLNSYPMSIRQGTCLTP